MQILVLLTDLFDAAAGIQTFNRTLVKALDKLAEQRGWSISVLILNDKKKPEKITRNMYSTRVKFRTFNRNKIFFVFRVISQIFESQIAILGHVNFSPLALMLRLTRNPKHVFLTVFGDDVWDKLPFLRRWGARKVDQILSISKFTQNRMVEVNGVDPKRFSLFPCTLDPFYEARMGSGDIEGLQLPKGKIILSVSRLSSSSRYKGIDKVIEALPGILRDVPDAYLVIVGDGDDRSRLEELARSLRVDRNVVFAGRVEDGILNYYYKYSTVFVLPSGGEGFGIVFLEAMLYAKPCIGLRAGAIPEVIEDKKTGVLIKTGDTEGLTKSIIQFLQDEKLCRMMGKAGKIRLEQEFSFERFQKRLDSVLCG